MATMTSSFAAPSRDRIRQSLNLILSLAQVAAIQFTVLRLGTTDFSSTVESEPPIVPALYTFSIWTLIYGGSIAYSVYQALPQQRENDLLRAIGWWTASAFLATTLWAVAAAFQWNWLTVACMCGMMASLLGAFLQFLRYGGPRTSGERFWVVVPISIFMGYITVATIANPASVLWNDGFRDVLLPGTVWAVVLLLVAGAIASFVTLVSKGNVAYALTIIWALVGIVVANTVDRPNPAVAITAGGVALLVALTLLRTQVSGRLPTAR